MTRQKQIPLEFSETDRAFLRRLRLAMGVKANSKAIRALIREADAQERIEPVTIPTIVTVSIPARTAEIHRTTCVLNSHDVVRLRTLQVKLGCSTRMATIRQLIWDTHLDLVENLHLIDSRKEQSIWDAFLDLIKDRRNDQSNDQSNDKSSRATTRRVA